MKHEILENGDLKIYADAELQAELLEMGEDIQTDEKMYDTLEPMICNSDIEWVKPEEIAALTSAPILGIVTRDDNGELTATDKIWWYPNYAVRSPLQDLLEYGELIFTKAPE